MFFNNGEKRVILYIFIFRLFHIYYWYYYVDTNIRVYDVLWSVDK